MATGAITGHIDVALVALYVFWAFFFGLIYWLRKEDQREGYLLDEKKGDPLEILVPAVPAQKPYYLHDGTVAMKPDGIPDTRELNLKQVDPAFGAPMEPTGANPMLDGVGPGAYAMRKDEPETDHSGNPKIQPLRALPDFHIAKEDPDPRGLPVYAADEVVVGKIVDAWVDRAEALIRYYEVALDGGRSVLVPMVFLDLNVWRGRATVNVITSEQFQAVPATKKPDVVTKLEEDKISAYYAGADVLGGAVRKKAWSF